MRQCTQDDANKALWSISTTLRDSIAPKVSMGYMLTVLFYKYISDVQLDDITLPEGTSFYDLLDNSHEPANGKRIDDALHKIAEANSASLKGVFQNIRFDSEELGDEERRNDILRLMLESFACPKFDFRFSTKERNDRIGNAYNYLFRQFALEIGKATEEFYTPPEISELIACLMTPEPGDEIADPTCGTASLLLQCAAQVQGKTGGKHTYALYGQESVGLLWSLAQMNLFLHGEDNHGIACGDTLRSPLLLNEDDTLKLFDVIVAHPPFSLNRWDYENAEEDIFDRYDRGVPPRTRADYAFILHMIATMKPVTGRMAVMMPHGVLFRSGPEETIRASLIEENLLDAVIGLPGKLLYSTNIPAVILIFRKQKRDDSVLFIDASQECQSGKNQNILRRMDIDAIVTAYTKRQNIEKYARLATLDEIRSYAYNLNISRYVERFETEGNSDLRSLLQEKAKLSNELTGLDLRLKSYLNDFGISID